MKAGQKQSGFFVASKPDCGYNFHTHDLHPDVKKFVKESLRPMVDESVTVSETESPYDFDGIWKEFIREYWPEILRDVVPDLYEAVDFGREAEFLDKEIYLDVD